jgi:AraC-like DNA-binding protein
MRDAWASGPGRVVVAGAFGDVAVHHHPAVQVAIGLGGPLVVDSADGSPQRCAVAVMASGASHAMRSDGAGTALSVYLSPELHTATVLNTLARIRGEDGVWAVEHGECVADAADAALSSDGLLTAAELVVQELLQGTDARSDAGAQLHPQLRQALEFVSDSVPSRTDLVSVAREVALSPDYLGRLFRTQTGASFSATARWQRLLAGLHHLSRGASVTDAAHLAGFADGAHANRACRELTGITPSEIARALRDFPQSG